MRLWTRVFSLVSIALLLAGCASAGTIPVAPAQDLVATAAAEATAIVQQAQATALVIQAQALATAVVEQASELAPAPTPAAVPVAAAETPPVELATTMTVTGTDPLATPEGEVPEQGTGQVEVVAVGFAGDGGLIEIKFKAPPKVAERWWQGSVSVTDEASDVTYNEIPVMPKIGPLIGRPKLDGQLGYVMLVNALPPLRAGALVTVRLGEWTFEHVRVQ